MSDKNQFYLAKPSGRFCLLMILMRGYGKFYSYAVSAILFKNLASMLPSRNSVEVRSKELPSPGPSSETPRSWSWTKAPQLSTALTKRQSWQTWNKNQAFPSSSWSHTDCKPLNKPTKSSESTKAKPQESMRKISSPSWKVYKLLKKRLKNTRNHSWPKPRQKVRLCRTKELNSVKTNKQIRFTPSVNLSSNGPTSSNYSK